MSKFLDSMIRNKIVFKYYSFISIRSFAMWYDYANHSNDRSKYCSVISALKIILPLPPKKGTKN